MSEEKPSPERQKPERKERTSTESKSKPTEKEVGGFEAAGLKEPTRYGDWEVKGRCSDF